MTVQSADGTSFESIYQRFAPSVVGYLRGKGIDDPEAVMQEVFIQLIPRFNTIRGGESGVRTLLFSIAHARAVDELRRRKRSAPTVEYTPLLDTRYTASAEDAAELSRTNEGALAVLATLKPDQREVLLLRIVADLPLDEVARLMRRSTGSIKQLQRRALLALSTHPDIGNGGRS